MRHCLKREYKTEVIKLELIITYFLIFLKGWLFIQSVLIRSNLKYVSAENIVAGFRTIYRLLVWTDFEQ